MENNQIVMRACIDCQTKSAYLSRKKLCLKCSMTRMQSLCLTQMSKNSPKYVANLKAGIKGLEKAYKTRRSKVKRRKIRAFKKRLQGELKLAKARMKK